MNNSPIMLYELLRWVTERMKFRSLLLVIQLLIASNLLLLVPDEDTRQYELESEDIQKFTHSQWQNQSCFDMTPPHFSEFGLFGYKYDKNDPNSRWTGTYWIEFPFSGYWGGNGSSVHITNYLTAGTPEHYTMIRWTNQSGYITIWSEFRVTDSTTSPQDIFSDQELESDYRLNISLSMYLIDDSTGAASLYSHTGQIYLGNRTTPLLEGYCDIFHNIPITWPVGETRIVRVTIYFGFEVYENDFIASNSGWVPVPIGINSIVEHEYFSVLHADPIAAGISDVVEDLINDYWS